MSKMQEIVRLVLLVALAFICHFKKWMCKMSESKTTNILAAIWMFIIVVTLGILSFTAYMDYKVCDANGGAFVRGIVWFKCVQVK